MTATTRDNDIFLFSHFVVLFGAKNSQSDNERCCCTGNEKWKELSDNFLVLLSLLASERVMCSVGNRIFGRR